MAVACCVLFSEKCAENLERKGDISTDDLKKILQQLEKQEHFLWSFVKCHCAARENQSDVRRLEKPWTLAWPLERQLSNFACPGQFLSFFLWCLFGSWVSWYPDSPWHWLWDTCYCQNHFNVYTCFLLAQKLINIHFPCHVRYDWIQANNENSQIFTTAAVNTFNIFAANTVSWCIVWHNTTASVTDHKWDSLPFFKHK